MKARKRLPGWLATSVGLALVLLLTGCAGGRKSSPDPQPGPAKPPVETPNPQSAEASRKWLEEAAAKPSLPLAGEGWKSLFNEVTLQGWTVINYAGAGDVECDSGLIVLNMGDPFTGIRWTNDFPQNNYEIALDAMRWMGNDFFCGLTVPVGTNHCTLVAGGWGGSLLGISSLNGYDASENESTRFVNFEKGKWYRLRLRVTKAKLEAWVDDEKLVDVLLEDKRVSLRPGEIERSVPLGITSWQTTSLVRHIKWRTVEEPADPVKVRR